MEKKKSLSERKREAILDAAVSVFQESGFQGASMDRIAERAQVSKRTVYNHFTSKEALFIEITEQVWRKAMDATEFPYQSDAPLAPQLTAIAEQELELLGSEGYIAMARMVLAEYMLSPDLARQAMQKMQENEGGTKRWLKAAMADKRLIKVDPEFAATQFMSQIKAFAFWPQIVGHAPNPTQAERREIVAAAVEMFLGRYAAPKKS
ncbi:TetR family transcriptional regulator [Hahella sp. KA22]|uniref:TetR/AcrR family transcriptional regulator n=1 Tax=Hahella sp. KA22 TaxID=1628392 RepID=UPI000FDF25AB|nr:TetR/AcrR family transcriptional regulator [Hahella sp. KA22]AZZ92348.1 TetR family transcriptional regulator [Hahella sp. KA22]QAY55721.1 TetR family transcriptional regulator [Hahella sp. KA22]